MNNTESLTFEQKLFGFMELINNKIDVVLQQNQCIYQEINDLKTQIQLTQYQEHPRKRICTNDREKINTHTDPDDSHELKRKIPKHKTINSTFITNESEESSKESDNDSDVDEKERSKWLEMEALKHRISEIETKTRNVELDHFHMRDPTNIQISYIS